LSNLYLHYVLDIWYEKAIKPKLKGESFLVRYIDDFVVCFQYEADAKRFQKVLEKRLAKFELQLEPNKTSLIEFGRFAEERAKKNKERCKILYFLGFTHFCTRNIRENFMGYYNYYGIAGNTESIVRIYRFTEKYWRTILSKRCWKGTITWEKYNRLLQVFPMIKPKLAITYGEWKSYSML
jgi:RNA-directed DNA polymerase